MWTAKDIVELGLDRPGLEEWFPGHDHPWLFTNQDAAIHLACQGKEHSR